MRNHHEISDDHIQQIVQIHQAFDEGDHSKLFATTDFGYRKITVERPLRLSFQTSPERIAWLQEEKAFQSLAVSKKRSPEAKAAEEAGPTLHPDKTRIVDARARGGFDFLGYHFERGHRWPSDRSLKQFKDTIRACTPRVNGRSLDRTISGLNPRLRG